MPELPEVERAVRALRRAARGRVIAGVATHHPSMRRHLPPRVRASLVGRRIESVERRGKHQLVHLDDGRILEVHFRMNGDWSYGRAADPLPRFTRLTLDFTDGTRAALVDSRALGTARVHGDYSAFARLGPEPDDPSLTAEALRATLATRRIPIKVALLDQRVIAGLGNIYAAEALWRARIDPRASARALDVVRLRALLRAVRFVLRRATGGRYTDDSTVDLDVYDRAGEPCRRCRTPVARIVQAGRSTYFCPSCQRDR
jgi:formamidopyrimidine-DNA glycosylase